MLWFDSPDSRDKLFLLPLNEYKGETQLRISLTRQKTQFHYRSPTVRGRLFYDDDYNKKWWFKGNYKFHKSVSQIFLSLVFPKPQGSRQGSFYLYFTHVKTKPKILSEFPRASLLESMRIEKENQILFFISIIFPFHSLLYPLYMLPN